MAKIKLTGESTGYVEISAANNASNNTLELPSGSKLVGSDDNGNVNNLGVVTATTFDGNLTGNVTGNVTGEVTISGGGGTFDSNVGIQTNDITRSDLVGAGNSFVGLYIGDGFLAFSTSLNRPDGYYISTSINALNAGPVTLGSTMTLDGTWVII